jgi:hypothetical protein
MGLRYVGLYCSLVVVRFTSAHAAGSLNRCKLLDLRHCLRVVRKSVRRDVAKVGPVKDRAGRMPQEKGIPQKLEHTKT